MGERIKLYSFDFMHKDECCARVDMFNDGTVETTNYASCVLDLPFGVKTEGITERDLDEFLEWRCVPKTRFNIREILDSMGLQFYEPYEIVRVTHGVMCDDTYWVRFEGESLSWSDVNPLLKI